MADGTQSCTTCGDATGNCQCVHHPILNIHLAPLSLDIQIADTAQEALIGALSFDLDTNAKARFADRLKEVSAADVHFRLIPETAFIEVHVVQPLRQAKVSFALAHYDACIAMCGMVAEKLIVLLYDVLDLDGNGLSSLLQADEFAKPFDELDQFHRIDLLLAENGLSQHDASAFHRIRKIRNNYVHARNGSSRTPRTDALESYNLLVSLLDRFLNLKPSGTEPGMIALTPRLEAYLRRQGGLTD